MAPRHPEVVERDQQVLSRLARIDHKLDSLEQTNAFALRAESEKHMAVVKAIFLRSKRRAQVYLAADGSRTVQEIAAFLPMHRPNVSRELSTLVSEGLLEVVDSSAAGDVYAKKPLDRTLRISRFLCDEYGLQREGKPAKKAGKPVRKSGRAGKRRSQRRKAR